jgi:hypothetical protein
MDQKKPITDLSRLCTWMDWEGEIPPAEEDLKNWLILRIGDMLQHQGERLMQAFYRLDISEDKVKDIFANHLPVFWPELLAGLVLEREKQRAAWRLKYQEKDKNS